MVFIHISPFIDFEEVFVVSSCIAFMWFFMARWVPITFLMPWEYACVVASLPTLRAFAYVHLFYSFHFFTSEF
jgi:hypothetical protein